MIKCAAIKTPDGKIVSLPKPNRHHDIIRIIFESDGNYDHNSIQGFLTIDDKFVDRIKALKIALESKQIQKTNFNQLYSEDLW